MKAQRHPEEYNPAHPGREVPPTFSEKKEVLTK